MRPSSEALNNTQRAPFVKPEGPSIAIPAKNLLGCKEDGFYYASVPQLPQTVDGKPVPSFAELDMRPRHEQLYPKLANPDAKFPDSQRITLEMRPLIEVRPWAFEAAEPELLPQVARKELVHTSSSLERRAS